MKAHETFTVDAAVTVRVSTELLERLGEWSEPVQVMIRETPGVGTGWELIARTVQIEAHYPEEA